VPQHFQESTASTEGARFAALTDKNEVFPQAETEASRFGFWLSKNAQGAGGSSSCRVWAEPTFLVPQHFQESTASTEGARFAALTDKNEVFRQAETEASRFGFWP